MSFCPNCDCDDCVRMKGEINAARRRVDEAERTLYEQIQASVAAEGETMRQAFVVWMLVLVLDEWYVRRHRQHAVTTRVLEIAEDMQTTSGHVDRLFKKFQKWIDDRAWYLYETDHQDPAIRRLIAAGALPSRPKDVRPGYRSWARYPGLLGSEIP